MGQPQATLQNPAPRGSRETLSGSGRTTLFREEPVSIVLRPSFLPGTGRKLVGRTDSLDFAPT